MTGVVGHHIADVVGAVGDAGGVQGGADHSGPRGTLRTAPAWKTLEATPETASVLVPVTSTVPLTVPGEL